MFQLQQQFSVGDFVKSLAEVEHRYINLGVSIQDTGEVMGGDVQLGLTGSSFAEAMLAVVEDIVRVEMLHSFRYDYVLNDFTAYGR